MGDHVSGPIGTAVPSGVASDGCDPTLCALASRPHGHCACGLPMAVGEMLCQLCRAECLDPIGRLTPRRRGDALVWDGHSRPSRRRCRVGAGEGLSYQRLIAAVLLPNESDDEDAPATVRRGRRKGGR
jgi:hypothetical protein